MRKAKVRWFEFVLGKTCLLVLGCSKFNLGLFLPVSNFRWNVYLSDWNFKWVKRSSESPDFAHQQSLTLIWVKCNASLHLKTSVKRGDPESQNSMRKGSSFIRLIHNGSLTLSFLFLELSRVQGEDWQMKSTFPSQMFAFDRSWCGGWKFMSKVN